MEYVEATKPLGGLAGPLPRSTRTLLGGIVDDESAREGKFGSG